MLHRGRAEGRAGPPVTSNPSSPRAPRPSCSNLKVVRDTVGSKRPTFLAFAIALLVCFVWAVVLNGGRRPADEERLASGVDEILVGTQEAPIPPELPSSSDAPESLMDQSLGPSEASSLRVRLIALWVGSRLSSPSFERYAWYAAGCNYRTKSIVDEHEKDDRVDVLAVVDEAYNASFVASAACPRLTIHRVQNLSDFLHDGIDRHIPEAAGHERFVFGRKACDLRWMFGELFQEQLKGYSWWGWLDAHSLVNGILGPTTRFGQVLLESDVVAWNVMRPTAWRRNYLSVRGLMALVSNTPKMNRLYRDIPDIAKLLTTPELLAVDELDGAFHVLTQPGVTVAWIDHLNALEVSVAKGGGGRFVRRQGVHVWIPPTPQLEEVYTALSKRDCSQSVSINHLVFMFDRQRSRVIETPLPSQTDMGNVTRTAPYPAFGILTKSGTHEWRFQCHHPDVYHAVGPNAMGIAMTLASCRYGSCLSDVRTILSQPNV